MENTSIEWTDHTFNPWRICTPVSPGCANCYAAALAKRTGVGEYRKGVPRIRTSAGNWKKPLKWNRRAELAEAKYEHYCLAGAGASPGAPERPRVFCASLADWLDDEAPIEWLADLLQLIHDTPQLDWLLLTKRPENWKPRLMAVMRKFENDPAYTVGTLPASYHFALDWAAGDAPANVWIGTTVEDQTRADQRIPLLLNIPAKVRFLSCEPLLGPVDLSYHLRLQETFPCKIEDGRVVQTGPTVVERQPDNPFLPEDGYGIHWVIAGGESGPKARPMHPDWARSLRDQCDAAQVPFLFKQWGEWAPPPEGVDTITDSPWRDVRYGEFHQKHGHGFIECCMCSEGDYGATVYRVGKKAAGRHLDGVNHDAFPQITL